MSQTARPAEERGGSIRCELCSNHTEPDMDRMHDHLSDEHDLFTLVIKGVTTRDD